jgi:hypothetical protein
MYYKNTTKQGRTDMIKYTPAALLLIISSWSFAQTPSITSFGNNQIGLSALSPRTTVELTFDVLNATAEPLGNIPALIIPGVAGTPLAPVGALAQLGTSAAFNLGDTLGIVENLAIPTAEGLAPIVSILLDEPLTIAEYILSGGTILNPALGIPAVPLVSAPLPQILPPL